MERYSQSDYTAGEMNDLSYMPNGRFVDGAQFHAFTFVGGWWGSSNLRFSDSELADYSSKVIANGGVLTYDLGTMGMVWRKMGDKPTRTPNAGYIEPAQIEQMKAVVRSVKQGQKQ